MPLATELPWPLLSLRLLGSLARSLVGLLARWRDDDVDADDAYGLVAEDALRCELNRTLLLLLAVLLSPPPPPLPEDFMRESVDINWQVSAHFAPPKSYVNARLAPPSFASRLRLSSREPVRSCGVCFRSQAR